MGEEGKAVTMGKWLVGKCSAISQQGHGTSGRQDCVCMRSQAEQHGGQLV